MRQCLESTSRSARLLLVVAFAFFVLPLTSPSSEAIPPRPELYDPKTGLHRTSGHPLPSFPAWFGKGLQTTYPVSGERRAVTLLVEFPDRLADASQRPPSDYQDLFFSLGVVPTGSLRDTYLEQSYGTYEVTGDTHGWLRTAGTYAANYDDGTFGMNGGGRSATKAALDLADPNVDFGAYDSDGPDEIPNSGDDDGYVDACFMVYAGAGGHDTGNPSDIWAHASGFDPNYLTNDPAAGGGFIRILKYMMQPEVDMQANGDSVRLGLGIPAHEYGHVLGLPDLYDGSRDTWGLGYWCLMAYGANLSRGNEMRSPVHMSAWCKERLGWVTPVVVTQNLWDIVIPPVETNSVVYKVWRDGIPGGEYFLLENRQNLGFDDILPGKGLLIWHIDHTSTPTTNLVDLEEADGNDDLEDGTGSRPGPGYHPQLGDAGDPYPGDSLNTVFNGTSYPASLDNSGSPTEVSIESIQLDGNNVRLDILIDDLVAVLIQRFDAKRMGAAVRLEWELYADEPLAGFNIYRREGQDGYAATLNKDGLIAEADRSFDDTDVEAGRDYYYALGVARPDGSEVRSPFAEVRTIVYTFSLDNNYPNPFNPRTVIQYTLARAAIVDLSIYNCRGQWIVRLDNGRRSAGPNSASWDGRDNYGNIVSTGVYFYRLVAGDEVLTRKMVLLK